MVENYTKDLKESVYHGAVVSALAIGYTMLGKTLIKMSPPSLSKFDVEDAVKLVAIVAMSDFTKDYLIRQKILPSNILLCLVAENTDQGNNEPSLSLLMTCLLQIQLRCYL